MTSISQSMRLSAPNSRVRRKGNGRATGLLFILPYAIIFLLFVTVPLVVGIRLGLKPSNYTELLADPVFRTAAWNTALFVLISVNVKMIVALGLSAFFAVQKRWIGLLLVIFILPWAAPSIPTILSFRIMLNAETGVINQQLFHLFGIMEGPAWLTNPKIAFVAAIVVHIWKSLPFWTLTLLTGRLAISQDLYDAASVDGASAIQKFRFITWPSLSTLYLTSTFLSIIWTLGDFNSIYLLTGGGPADQTQVLATVGIKYVSNGRVDLGIASVLMTLPVILPLVFIMMSRLSKGSEQ